MPDPGLQRSAPNPSDEIPWTLIVASLIQGWRWLLAGALLGPVAAALLTSTLGSTNVELFLNNTCVALPKLDALQDKVPEKACSLTFSRWRLLSESLPALASHRAEALKAQGMDVTPLEALSQPLGWEKHVVPIYGLSQADSKRFSLINDQLKADATAIGQLKIIGTAHAADQAVAAVEQTVAWIRDASTYIELKSLLDGYASERTLSAARIAEDTLRIQLESGYLQARVEQLARLRAEDLQHASGRQTLVDVGGVETPFLPLNTQINAAEVALIDQESQIHRLQDQTQRNEILGQFLTEAEPRLGAPYEGASAAVMIDQMLKALEPLTASITGADPSRRAAVARILGDVRRIESRYGVQLPELSRTITPPSLGIALILGSALIGAALGFLAYRLQSLLASSETWPR